MGEQLRIHFVRWRALSAFLIVFTLLGYLTPSARATPAGQDAPGCFTAQSGPYLLEVAGYTRQPAGAAELQLTVTTTTIPIRVVRIQTGNWQETRPFPSGLQGPVTMTVTLPDFRATRPVTIRIAGDAPTVLWRVDLAHPACDHTPFAPLAPRLSPAVSPVPTSADLLPDLPTTQAHVLMASDFEHTWTVAEEQAMQEIGLPLPAVVTTTLNLFELVAAPARAATPMANAEPSGWQPLYRQTFDGGFPRSAQDGACQLVTLSSDPRLRWGVDVSQSFHGSPAAATPGVPRLSATPTLTGTPTLPGGARVQFACVFDNLTATRNLLIQFALNLAAAGPESSLFVGVATDGQTFHGRRWVAPPAAPEGNLAGTEQRLFAPLLELAPPNGTGRVAVLFDFRAGSKPAASSNLWLDDLVIEQFAPVDAGCRALDPQLQLPGAPGAGLVSKGLNLPPYPMGTPTGLPGHVARLRAMGVQWVRLEFQAQLLQQATPAVLAGPGGLLNYVDLKHYDTLLALLCGGDPPIAALGLLDYKTLASDGWRADPRLGDAYETRFSAVAALLARYYADRIGHWEIWNEPDFADSYLAPAAYARLLGTVSAALKAQDGALQVVFGGLGGADWPAVDYLQQVLAALPSGALPFDIFALHPYPSQQFRRNGQIIRDPSYLHYQAPTVLAPFMAALHAAGYGDRPIWITEIGWNRAADSTNPATLTCRRVYETMVTGAEQAAYVPTQFDILFKETAWDTGAPGVAKIFWYQYADVGLNLSEGECQGWRGEEGGRNASWIRWYGLYSGTDRTQALYEPTPNLAACTYRAYPDPEALNACQ